MTDKSIDSSDNMKSQSEEKFITVDELANSQNLIACYQMQVDKNDVCSPVYLGSYPDVPLPVNKTLQFGNHNMHVVTYVLTENEVKDKIYKIVGINVFKNNKRNSKCSLDLVMNDEQGCYQLLFNDHRKDTSQVVENLEKFPGRKHVLDYVIKKAFEEEPLKSILLQ